MPFIPPSRRSSGRGGDISDENRNVLREGKDIPLQDNDVPREDKDILDEDINAPNEDKGNPHEDNDLPHRKHERPLNRHDGRPASNPSALSLLRGWGYRRPASGRVADLSLRADAVQCAGQVTVRCE